MASALVAAFQNFTANHPLQSSMQCHGLSENNKIPVVFGMATSLIHLPFILYTRQFEQQQQPL
jgi:hypothetical protein